MQRSRGQSWDECFINCFGVWYNLHLAIRGLYHPQLRLGWYSPLIARYKLYHTPKQLITNSIIYNIIYLSNASFSRRAMSEIIFWMSPFSLLHLFWCTYYNSLLRQPFFQIFAFGGSGLVRMSMLGHIFTKCFVIKYRDNFLHVFNIVRTMAGQIW